MPWRRGGSAVPIALLLLVAVTLTPGSRAWGAAPPLVKGKGVAVTQEHLDEAFINLSATMATQGRAIPEKERATVERQLMEKLALTQLLLQRATAEDRQKATNKVGRLLDEQRAKARSPARFDAQIRAAGLSPENFQKQLEERAICEEVLDRELRPTLGITPEKVRAFYDEHPEQFRQPERVRLRQVVLTFRQGTESQPAEAAKAQKLNLARRLLDRARKGEDLAALAREYSDDPVGRDRGGEYLFPVDRMVPELELAVRTAPMKQLLDLVTTPFGYHIVEVLEKLPGERVPFDEVADRIRVGLELEATQKALPGYQEKLFQEAKVEFLKKD